jgi:hypothetical protein
MHKFSSSSDEYSALIYNYKPTYTAKSAPDYQQCYFFG